MKTMVVWVCRECGKTITHMFPSCTIPDTNHFHVDHFVIMDKVAEVELPESTRWTV